MTSKKQKPRESLDFQTWICPKCFDDHKQGGPCSPIDSSVFMPSESDHSHIANEYRRAQAEIERLKEIISHLPKVPTQPYEKELAQELDKYKKLCEMMRGAFDQSLRQWRMYAEIDIQDSVENGLKEDPGNMEFIELLRCQSVLNSYDAAINPKPNLNTQDHGG